MLKADIEKADHRGWIDARKENISELQGQFADYQKLQTQYTNDLNGFLKDLASLEKSQANAPLDEKRGNLEALLNALPKPLGLENRLAPHQNAISKLDPSIQRDADMLNADFQELDTSRSLLDTKLSNLKNKLGNAKSAQEMGDIRNELGTLESLIKRHNSDTRSYQRLSDHLIEKLPGQEIRSSELTIQPLSKNGKVLLDRVAKGQVTTL